MTAEKTSPMMAVAMRVEIREKPKLLLTFGKEAVDLKYGSTEVRKYGSTEVRKYGSTEVRKYGSTEVRKYGSTEVHNISYLSL